MSACLAVACDVRPPGRLSFCTAHWFSIPDPIRDLIRRAYRKGMQPGEEPAQWHFAVGVAVACLLLSDRPEGVDIPARMKACLLDAYTVAVGKGADPQWLLKTAFEAVPNEYPLLLAKLAELTELEAA